jgi:hypothetical protein
MRISNNIRFAALAVGTALAVPGIATADELADREQAAEQATQQLLQQLGAALKQQMGSEGPESAVTVCRDIAPQIAGKISRANGWRMTRVGTRVRNPLLGMPDAWEAQVLKDFAARAEKGESYQDMRFSEVREEDGRRYFRFMKAIGIQPLCLTCHGNAAQIPPGVQARLDDVYPMDRATGYRAGDLRGAVSIKQPMELPLAGGQADAD